MNPESTVTTIAHVIQLAVAPVFLLAGVGAILSVLTTRLSRIVDRARVLEQGLGDAGSAGQAELRASLTTLARRGSLANWAISLCTLCALLVCAVIVVLFIGAFLHVDASIPVALLFIAAMLALIGGLLCFLREIHLATAHLPTRPR